jgi:cytochrome P450
MREEPGESNKWQLATAHASNMGFGLGRHVCPGRFFAVHHIKISLCHLLLKYDWRFVPGADAAQYDFEESVRRIKPSFQVQYRRRAEEINLDDV